ncbi:MAG: type II toxin-antitoxin system CcdA family antitoxin [Polyangiaceae bacterium]|nr:type II toxin-antitoxin system CcdA family antitoxin [Polyangiaceae bacterium]
MPRRTPVNVSLPVELVSRAKELGINLSRAAEAGLAEAIAQANSPGFRFGALKDKVTSPPLDVFAPMTNEELDAWNL